MAMGSHNTVDSDQRMLSILEALQEQHSAGVTTLSTELGMAKSTVHSHLLTLKEEGYIVQNSDGTYEIGLKFLDMGTTAQENRAIYSEAKPKLEELAVKTNEKAWCVVEEHGKAVFLAKAVSGRSIRTNARVGQHVPLYRLAAGKAILANLPKDRQATILGRYEFPLGDTEIIRSEFEEELERIREDGTAFVSEQFIHGVAGVAAPILDTSNSVYGAICVSGPDARLSGNRLETEVADLVRGVAGEIRVNISHN